MDPFRLPASVYHRNVVSTNRTRPGNGAVYADKKATLNN